MISKEIKEKIKNIILSLKIKAEEDKFPDIDYDNEKSDLVKESLDYIMDQINQKATLLNLAEMTALTRPGKINGSPLIDSIGDIAKQEIAKKEYNYDFTRCGCLKPIDCLMYESDYVGLDDFVQIVKKLSSEVGVGNNYFKTIYKDINLLNIMSILSKDEKIKCFCQQCYNKLNFIENLNE